MKDEVFNKYFTLGDNGSSWLGGGLFITSNLRLNFCISDSSSGVSNHSRTAQERVGRFVSLGGGVYSTNILGGLEL